MASASRRRALSSILLSLPVTAVGPPGTCAQPRAATLAPVGALPTGIAVHPATNTAYASDQADSTVSVVDGATIATTLAFDARWGAVTPRPP